ncbi:MAG: GMC family oxidoreductase N-terminal domain-containing protein [Gemmatimonadota bacterium]
MPRGTANRNRSSVIERSVDVAIVGSGAGGGTVAKELGPLARDGRRVLVLEQGPKLRDEEYTGRELEMAEALYAANGGFLNAEGTLTLALGRAYGGSTTVYTGTSLVAPERVIRGWDVPGVTHADVAQRSRKYMSENNVHLLEPELINENNRLFVDGCRRAGYRVEQFPINVKGCLGSSLCNLGCPNGAKQGTDRVQLPEAERSGVEVVTRAEVVRLERRAVVVRVIEKEAGAKGEPSPWAPGEYRVRARVVVLAGGAVGSPALLRRSPLPLHLPRVGRGFTCHPALILVAEHDREITNDVGHPKSYYVDRAAEEGFVLETCMYFPFATAKSLTGFGPDHSRLMRAFPRLQMILVLACDRAVAANRVDVDRTGQPVVHYRFTREVVRSFALATRAAARIFFAGGAVRMHAPLAEPPLLERSDADSLEERVRERHFRPGKISVSAAHLMGGCGMGRDRSDSVTDGWGRVHGEPWLRVADASLFPDALHINPYLTIMALADRVAEGIRAEAADLLGTAPAERPA